jgi:hypothetical protein
MTYPAFSHLAPIGGIAQISSNTYNEAIKMHMKGRNNSLKVKSEWID